MHNKLLTASLLCMGADRESLLLRGVLDLCLLALLESRPVYGYEVAARLNDRGLAVAAGSVYPLLARLQHAGDLQAEERPSPSGPPRKWWSLTPRGHETLASGRASWATVSQAVTSILARASEHDSSEREMVT